jgi:hypothetical protein
VGVIVAAGPPVLYADTGQTSVTSALSFQAVAGDNICTDSSANNAEVVDSGTSACPPTQKLIGYANGDGSSGTSHVIQVSIGDAGTSVGAATNWNQLIASTANNTPTNNANYNITVGCTLTGSTDCFDFSEVGSASTGTGSQIGMVLKANSTNPGFYIKGTQPASVRKAAPRGRPRAVLRLP